MGLDELELSAPVSLPLNRTTPSTVRTPAWTFAPFPLLVPNTWAFRTLLAIILATGIALRLFLPAGFTGTGFDENLYRTYIILLDRVGISHYSALIDAFIADQLNPHHMAILPPTRIFYIVGGYVYHHLFGLAPLSALRALSCHFSVLTLLISILFCWRLTRQPTFTAVVATLVACAPTQIHLGQHALIDGVFGFWALLVLWLLWENLQRPNTLALELIFGAALAITVMTKENAFFVFIAILGLFGANHWLHFGWVTRRLVLTTFTGALLGLIIVVVAAGGVEQFALVFELLKQKVPVLAYTIKTGGGPWHRYLVDLLLVSPAILILALANLLAAKRHRSRADRYLGTFSCLSYLALTAFPDGMNLRYIVMLDMPLRFLATTQLFALSRAWGHYRHVLLALAVIALCAYDLRQHDVLFVKGNLYELVTEGLIRAQGIIK